jgi:hypothetical protein
VVHPWSHAHAVMIHFLFLFGFHAVVHLFRHSTWVNSADRSAAPVPDDAAPKLAAVLAEAAAVGLFPCFRSRKERAQGQARRYRWKDCEAF